VVHSRTVPGMLGVGCCGCGACGMCACDGYCENATGGITGVRVLQYILYCTIHVHYKSGKCIRGTTLKEGTCKM
jgi:hypothetical protein